MVFFVFNPGNQSSERSVSVGSLDQKKEFFIKREKKKKKTWLSILVFYGNIH